MHIKRSTSDKIADTLIYSFLVLFAICMLYPFYYVVMASFSNPYKLMAHRGLLFYPQGLSVEAYKYVLREPMILRGYWNTLNYVVFGVMINMFMTILGAYVLSRKNLLLKKPLMFMAVFTMFFDGGMIPFYLQVRALGITDTVWSILLPVALITWNLIIMRTYFQSIPYEMEESARIDGANDFVILARIIVPLAKPVIAVVVLYYAVMRWNAWFYALLFLDTRTKYPLQVILREILIVGSTSGLSGDNLTDKFMIGELIKYAAIVIATLPILCVYPFVQKYFMKGVMIGALKG